MLGAPEAERRDARPIGLHRRLSLRAKVLVPLVALFVLVEVASVAGALVYSQSAATNAAVVGLERESGNVARALNASLQERVLAIDLAGKALDALASAPGASPADAEGALAREVVPLLSATSNRGFDRVLVTAADGRVVADYRDGGLVLPPPGAPEASLAENACFEAPRRRADVYLSPEGVAPEAVPGDGPAYPMCVARAFRNVEGDVAGVLVGIVRLEDLVASVASPGTHLLVRSGLPVAAEPATASALVDPDTLPGSFWGGAPAPLSVLERGERHVAVATLVREFGPGEAESEAWIAVSLLPARTVGADAVWLAARIAIASTAALVAIAAVIAWVLERALRPVSELAEAAARVGEGDFAARVDVRTGDELERLAGTFNGMVSQLAERERRLADHSKSLARSEKLAAIGTLAAGVAHEINNPLAFIKGNEQLADVLLADVESAPDVPERVRADVSEVRESLRVNSTGVARIERIVRSLRQFARPSTQKQRVPLREIVDGALVLAQNRVRAANAHVESSYPASLAEVNVNADEIGQVVLNLLVNAVDAHEGRPGTIRVVAREEPGFVALDVSDEGVGIPDHVARNIFTPFVTTKPSGTGLGLSISHRIVEEHGGTMSFRTTPGHGTTFTVRLPVATATERHDASDPDAHPETDSAPKRAAGVSA